MANDTKVVDGKIVTLTDAEQTARDAEIKAYNDEAHTRAWVSLRTKRNELLAECDWTVVSDTALSDSKKTEWINYRKLLRDFPGTLNDTSVQGTITWPTKPS